MAEEGRAAARGQGWEGWGSPAAFLRPALARVLAPLSDTLLFLPQKVWIACAETHRARQRQGWKTLSAQGGGQSRCICHLGSRELTWKSISRKPRGQIHCFFYHCWFPSFTSLPPGPAASSFFSSASLFIVPLQQDSLYCLSLQLASADLLESGSTVAKKYSNILRLSDCDKLICE